MKTGTQKIALALLFVISCGSSEQLALDLSAGQGAEAFADAAAADLVIELTSIAGTLGKVIDSNNDGVADQFVYPVTCGVAKAASCGYSLATKSSPRLEGLPKGYEYQLKAVFRNASGIVLYEGNAQVNTTSQQSVSVNVVKK